MEAGAREVVIGLGGSATNDGGAGMLAALGAAPLDARRATRCRTAAPRWPAATALGGVPRLRDVRLVAATDVDNPLTGLHGATSVFGPQKGATREDVLLLDAALERFAGVLEKDLPTCPPGLPACPAPARPAGSARRCWPSAAGSTPGIGLVRELTGLDAALDAADLVITGEGSFDEQSLRGKVVAGVAGARPRPRSCPAWCWPGGSPPGGVRPRRPGSPRRTAWSSTSASVERGHGRGRPRACAGWPPGWPGSGRRRDQRPAVELVADGDGRATIGMSCRTDCSVGSSVREPRSPSTESRDS